MVIQEKGGEKKERWFHWAAGGHKQSERERERDRERQREMSQIVSGDTVRPEEFSVIQSIYSMRSSIKLDPPALGRAICFSQSSSSDVNIIQKHPHRNTQNNV